ncbi:MAG: MATE family efflux transporter [Calditrichaeota bacterium]|nr:MAG: MATE family efflux transporter [Calditrichota bacterium]
MQTFSRRFFRLAVPNIISNVTVPLVGLADTIMLGHLPQVRFLAGVALASVIFDYVYWTFGFLRMGTTGTTAQALGRREIDEVYRLLYRSLFVALALGTGILVLQQPIRQLSFALLSGAPDVEAAGREYFNARIWGAPAALCNFVFIGWYLGREESQNALYMTLIANLSNIVLNYIFLYKMHLQAFGAGLGSMISQYLMLGLGLWIFYRRKHRIAWRWREILNWPRISAMLQLNFDILVRTLCLISAFALFTNFSAVLGTGLLVANSILLRILGFAAYFIDGAAFATESLAGIFHGEQNRPALQHLLRYALLWGEIFAFGFIAILLNRAITGWIP